ncbi:MAG: hypothetical protein HWN68_19690 [Desulfobacterales bacterium]|nr:hypothetical protein [Desulfobacterales bacterium]
MDNVLTATCTHKNNPTGASLATVATGIACSPIDPLDKTYTQAYPIEKLFLMRQSFTKYIAFAAGDYLVSDSTTYAVKAVHPWPALGSLDLYYHLILEQTDLDPVIPYSDRVLGTSPIAYWPLWETEGEYAECLACTPGQNGVYVEVTLANILGPDGVHYAPLFDGENDYVNIYSTIFRDAFNGNAGTLMIWVKIAEAVWTDGTLDFWLDLRVDTNNEARIIKSAANQIQWWYRAGGTINSATKSGVTTTDWMCLGLTWDKEADQVQPYYNGDAEGAALTGLDVWAGVLGTCLIGAQTTVPANPANAWEAQCAIWASALSAAQIATLATV